MPAEASRKRKVPSIIHGDNMKNIKLKQYPQPIRKWWRKFLDWLFRKPLPIAKYTYVRLPDNQANQTVEHGFAYFNNKGKYKRIQKAAKRRQSR